MPRLFIGWQLPGNVQRQIGAAIDPLKRKLPSASWVRTEAYHVTFSFLGDRPDSIISKLESRLDASLEGLESEFIVADTPGFFPHEGRPRVGWLRLGPDQALVRASERVSSAIDDLGLEIDRRSFRPHLTLVRTRGRWSRSDAKTFLDGLSGFRSPPCRFGEVVLFASEIRKSGAVHTALHRVKLSGE